VDLGAKLALSSNWGKETVSMVAPGVNVFSTLPGSTAGPLSGTVEAAAHVAGAVALYRAHKPARTAPEVAEDVPALSSNRDLLADRVRSSSILDLGLLIAEKRETVDAHVVAPTHVRVGQQVVFDGSTSEGPIVEYLWKFGDPRDEFGPVVPRTFTRPGRVGVELQVRTFDGRSASIEHPVVVEGNDTVGAWLGCDVGAGSARGAWPAAALAGLLLRRRRGYRPAP
jgi:MYXO-CTERM domain-containing protein